MVSLIEFSSIIFVLILKTKITQKISFSFIKTQFDVMKIDSDRQEAYTGDRKEG